MEYAYPFRNEDKDRFLDWLWKKNISYEDYMQEASSWGRYVHWALESYILRWEWKWKKYKGYVEQWIAFLKKGEYEVVSTEKYVKTKDYQGTIDLVVRRVSDGKYWIMDFKTYWLAKDKWGIPTVYKKPYDKLKKASLQLSLYSRAEKRKIEFISVIEIGSTYLNIYELDFWTDEELDTLIKEYKLSYIDNI